MAGTHYRDLFAWQSAVRLAESVYLCTRRFPTDEKFGLIAQARRAAVSVASNIAEGEARQSKAEFRRFLRVARGSLAELETQLEIAVRLKFTTAKDVARALALADEVGRMVSGLIRSLRSE